MSETKLEMAKRMVVRFIRDEKLQAGDKLPSHAELRQYLQLSTDTVNSAIQALKADGVVEVKNKVGVFVKDPLANGHVVGTIGIAVFDILQYSVFNNFVINAVNVLLNSYGYQTRIFYSQERLDHTQQRSLNEISGLERSVCAGELHALLSLDVLAEESLALLDKMNLPTVIFCVKPNQKNSLGINYFDYILRAKADLLAQNCRHLGLMVTHVVTSDFSQKIQTLLQKDDPQFSIEWLPDSSEAAYHSIMARSEEDRPDGIIVIDDTMMVNFTLELLRQKNCDYQPWVVNLKNSHFQIDLPFEKQLFYKLDQWHLAEFIAQNIFELAKNKKSWTSPKLYDIQKIS